MPKPIEWSQAFTIRSNARRAARQAGCDPNSVRSCSGGYQYELRQSTKAAKPKAETPATPKAAKPATAAKAGKPAKARKTRSAAGAKPSSTKPGTKLATALAMITAKGGATMPDICKATGWLEHTARARISGLVAEHNLNIERQRLLGVTWYIATPKAKAA